MANYYGTFRSNYFTVKNREEFERFCDRWGLTAISKQAPDSTELVGFYDSFGEGCPSCPRNWDDPVDDQGDLIEPPDLLDELIPLLDGSSVAIVMESGHEKARYVIGWATAMNAAGEKQTVSIWDIYEQAEELGPVLSRAEY